MNTEQEQAIKKFKELVLNNRNISVQAKKDIIYQFYIVIKLIKEYKKIIFSTKNERLSLKIINKKSTIDITRYKFYSIELTRYFKIFSIYKIHGGLKLQTGFLYLNIGLNSL